MSKNNLDYKSIYKNEKIMKKTLLVGLLSALFALDAIFIGYFRNIIGQKVLLKEFGQNPREEFYIYIMIYLGFFLISYFLTNHKKATLRIDEEVIFIKSNKPPKMYTKELKDFLFYEFIEEKKLLFHFKDEVISMDFDIVKRDEVMKALGRL